jgi:hypothetical protein
VEFDGNKVRIKAFGSNFFFSGDGIGETHGDYGIPESAAKAVIRTRGEGEKSL